MTTPYEIEHIDAERAVVRFAAGDVTEYRTPEQTQELLDLVDSRSKIAIDFSASSLVPSHWLRQIERMRVRAAAAGKEVVIVGASATIRKTADAIKLDQVSRWCSSLEEAWR